MTNLTFSYIITADKEFFMGLISKMILKRKKYPENYFTLEFLSETDNVYIVMKDGQFGLLDGTTRKLIMQLQDKKITSYSDGAVAVTKDGKAGYVDVDNKPLVECKYDMVEPFQANHLAIVIKNEMFGCVDLNFEEVVPVKYDFVSKFENGIAKIALRDKWGLVDQTGKIQGQIAYESIGSIQEGLVPVLKGSKWGYIDTTGKEVIPFKYSMAYPFNNGMAVVKQNGKQGVINRFGEKIIACRYDYVTSINDGIASVMLDQKFGYVDTQDKTIVPCELMASVGETDDDYTLAMNHIKKYYSKKVEGVKSQAAKNKLLAEFNQEMKKLADARVALYQYDVKKKQKQYRTEQLRQDCYDSISSAKQDLELPNFDEEQPIEENETTITDAKDEFPQVIAGEEVSDGAEYQDTIDSVPEDELEINQ